MTYSRNMKLPFNQKTSSIKKSKHQKSKTSFVISSNKKVFNYLLKKPYADEACKPECKNNFESENIRDTVFEKYEIDIRPEENSNLALSSTDISAKKSPKVNKSNNYGFDYNNEDSGTYNKSSRYDL